MTDWTDKELGGYRLEQRLGQGGVTAVYAAASLKTEQPVLVKVLQPEVKVNEARLIAWGKAATIRQHPHLVPILAVGWQEKTGYWVRPRLKGVSLATVLERLAVERLRLALPDSLRLCQQVAAALDYLHHQGEVHGSLHPANIWLEPRPQDTAFPWRAIVLDSAVWALLAGQHPHLLEAFPAHWSYAAPEQTEGFSPSPATDLYSLTAILYQLVTGRPPFAVHSLAEARFVQQQSTAPSPHTLRPDLPLRIEAIIRRGLSKQPERRLQTAHHLLTALQQVLDEPTLPGGELLVEWLVEDKQVLPVQTPVAAELVISRVGEPERLISLDKPVLTVGRSRKNDIFLPEDGVSRRHARVEWLRSGWHLVDLDSTNGVYLEHERLRPREPHFWPANEVAQLGGYALRWHPINPGDHHLPLPPLPPPPPQIETVSAAARFRQVFAFAFGDATGQAEAVAVAPVGEQTWATMVSNRVPDVMELPLAVATMTESVPTTFVDVVAEPVIEPETPAAAVPFPPLIEPMTPVSPLPVPLVRLTLIPVEIELTPGRESFIQVVVTNQGQHPERFYMRVEGLPPEWVSIPENQLYLEAGAQDILQINILNTLEKNIEPGQRTFIVRVSPETAPDIISVVTGYVNIKESISFATEMMPMAVWPGSSCTIHIRNLGNVETTFSLLARANDLADSLSFTGQGERLVLAPGQEGDLSLTVQMSTRPLMGRQKAIPFRVQIRASQGESQVKVGQINITPVIPWWWWLAGGTLCLLTSLLVLLLPI
ncbi:MAG: protein kinase [Chloroflexi bacterium]|nr:protein kinase [Chloroflexota bacterium]MBP8056382.1 protein kinase [Chloroflexota bacterium]